MDKNSDNNRKLPFEFMKDSNNGTILHIHHTVQSKSGETKRIRFTNVCFSDNNENLAAIDHRGNVFVFNLTSRLFWILTEKISKCSFAKFVPKKNNNLLIGTKKGTIVEVQINSNTILKTVQAHNESIRNMAPLPILSNLFTKTFLSSTLTESKIFDLEKFDEKHRFHFTPFDVHINSMDVLPKSDKIICCLNNNTIQILTNSFKKFNVLHPLTMKDSFATRHSCMIQEVKLLEDGYSGKANPNDKIKNLLKDSNNCLKNIAIHHGGKLMVVNCFENDNTLILYSTLTWEIMKMIKLPANHYIMQSQFLRHPDDKRNIIVFITTNQDLILLDLEDLQQKIIVHPFNCYKFSTSNNGKILSLILTSGEIFVYDLDFCFNELKAHLRDDFIKVPVIKSTVSQLEDVNKQMEQMMQEINKSVPKNRLLSILKEFGEYPQKYRPVIWRTLLQLPQNSKVFMDLVARGYHPCVENYDKLYPLYDNKSLRNLKKIISCLSYWTKVFGQIDYMPTLVYPFLSIFKNDSTLTFELIATILLNQCQLWFEFAPLEPFNYLGFIENILQEFEPVLMGHYREKNITAKIYALAMFENGFSEILDENQWLQLWDHILSNKNTFIVYLVAAYNIIQKPHLLELTTTAEFVYYFHDQNTIDIKNLIKLTYNLMEKCPENLNPEKYMKEHVKIVLEGNVYRKFENFPKKLIDLKSCDMTTMKLEERILEMKINELEMMEKTINEKKEVQLISDVQDKRLREVEQEYADTLEQENRRIACQRKLINLYHCKLKESQRNMCMELKRNAIQKTTDAKEAEFKNLISNLERERENEENQIFAVEEDLKLQDIDLTSQRDLVVFPKLVDTLVYRHENALKQLRVQKVKLKQEIAKTLDKGNNDMPLYLKTLNNNKMVRIGSIEEMFKKIQYDYVRLKQTARNDDQYKAGVKDLEVQTKFLETQVKMILATIKS